VTSGKRVLKLRRFFVRRFSGLEAILTSGQAQKAE